jgi:thiamine biosynthesis lipoprotein
MHRYLQYLALFLIALLISACSRSQPGVQEQQFVAFGTLISVTLYAVDEQQAQRAFQDLEKYFNQLHHDWHAWEPSPLVELNQALATQDTAEVPAVILPLIVPAQRLSIASGGLFNPAMGGLFALWGFQSDDPPRAPPADAEIKDLLAQHPNMADLQLNGTSLNTSNRAVKLDFGAFAKGYAAQLGCERLQQLGIDNAIVAVAGDIHVIGNRGERAWRVGVRHPRTPGIIASTELHDGESISTSGDYERYFDVDNIRYHHLLDPRTGYPARGAIAVTVINNDGAIADASASALFIAGVEHWAEVAKAMGVDQVMLIDIEGEVHLTPAMAARLRIEGDPAPELYIQELP